LTYKELQVRLVELTIKNQILEVALDAPWMLAGARLCNIGTGKKLNDGSVDVSKGLLP
jgi:hypothetical protein